jgi:hypothetical protein
MEAAPDVALDVTSLPRPLVRELFELLPLDTRLRCVEVCRAWRLLFSQPDLWTFVDFESLSSEQCGEPITAEMLWAASARAQGRIEVLDLRHCFADPLAVIAVVGANGGALRNLELDWSCSDPQELRTLLRAAPRLAVLHADVGHIDGTSLLVPIAEALPMLRREAPWKPLRARSVSVQLVEGDAANATRELAEALRCNNNIGSLNVVSFDVAVEPDALCELCDAAVAVGARMVHLRGCGLRAGAAPGLVTLLRARCLVNLLLANEPELLDRESAKPVVCALNDNNTVDSITLQHVGLWRDPMIGMMLCSALAEHRSLTHINLSGNSIGVGNVPMGVVLGTVYAQLLEANAPTLVYLNISGCDLTFAAAQPIVEALRVNTHLRHLEMWLDDPMAHVLDEFHAFEENELLSAVVANTALRWLDYTEMNTDVSTQIEAILEARRNADEEAERRASSGDTDVVADELGVEALAGALP